MFIASQGRLNDKLVGRPRQEAVGGNIAVSDLSYRKKSFLFFRVEYAKLAIVVDSLENFSISSDAAEHITWC
jgi:hypothetical protein